MEVFIVLIIIVGGIFFYAKKVGFDYYDNKRISNDDNQTQQSKYTPKQVFEALGVEIIEKRENGDYVIAYQGGYFLFSFIEDSEWVDIHFLNFESCKYEHIHLAQMVVNHVNLKYWGWTCFLRMSGDEAEEKTLNASLSYRFALIGTLPQIKMLLREVFEQAFYIVHDFRSKLAEDIKEKKDLDEQFLNDSAFLNKLAYLQRIKEANHLEERGEESPDSSELAIDNLIKLFDHVDFGELQELRIIRGEKIETITNVDEIHDFDIREYIRKQLDIADIRNLTLIFAFEHQDLFVNLTKAKGSTERSLFFVVNVVRSGSELDIYMDNRGPISSRTMMEIRLTDADKDYWEAKYMIDEAMDKVNSGKSDELTDEQRLVVSYSNPVSNLALYWGKKYYNNRCYFQALFYFNQIYWHLKYLKKEWNEEERNLYFDVSFYIGFIYVDLGMYDKAFYYLYMAQSQNNISAIKEFANCLCNINDPSAKEYVHAKLEQVVEQMNKSEEEAERLMDLYFFLRRRYVYILIERGSYDEAESLLHKMIEREEDVDFAKDELEYIKKQRGE